MSVQFNMHMLQIRMHISVFSAVVMMYRPFITVFSSPHHYLPPRLVYA